MPRATKPKDTPEPTTDPTSGPADTTSDDSAGPESDSEPKVPTKEENEAAAARILEDEASKRPVIVKLARIMEGLPEFKPEGRNQHFNYDFIKDTQISGALRGRLAKERVMIIPDVVEESMTEVPTKHGRSFLTKLKVHFTAIDGDSGDEVSGHGFGYGDDSGDKGANKAFTAALKYWLMKLMMIGGEDNEADPRADQRASDREVAGQPSQGVQIQGANITGVARGGVSEKITNAQVKQIGALYVDLGLSPEGLVQRFDKYLGIPLSIDEEGDLTQQLNKAVKALSGDDAGLFISKLVEEKDGTTVGAEPASEDEEAEEPGGGYGG